jgi:vancomycin resistance protein VanW
MLKRPSWIKTSIALRHPSLLALIVSFRRLERRVEWLSDGYRYAAGRSTINLEFRVKKHQSVLVRKLSSSDDRQLQLNKVENLKRVIERLDGILIRPGETFSFCRLVGKPTLRKGFLPGMELSMGMARAGVGGGICQSSNLIYWLVLHSPLVVVERHHHSFDPFPDQGRVLPFASGATVMYNYRDLRFRNDTSFVFQLRLWMDEKCLNGDLRSSTWLREGYQVYEKNHKFAEVGGKYFRENELWRMVTDKEQRGKVTADEFIVANHAEVRYVPVPDQMMASSSIPASVGNQ